MQRKLNDEFIREYSEEFSEKITSDFFAEKDHISGKEILNVTPSKQVNFFVLKILFRKWQEEMKRLESPFFNYRNPDVRKAMVQFMNTLSQHIEVKEKLFCSMLEEAVADTLLLAVDPGSYISLEFEEMDVTNVTEKMTKPIFKYLKLHKSEIEVFFEENNGADLDDFVENAEAFFLDVNVEPTVKQQVEQLSQVLPLSEEDVYFREEDMLRNEEDEELPEIEDEVDEVSFDHDDSDDEYEEESFEDNEEVNSVTESNPVTESDEDEFAIDDEEDDVPEPIHGRHENEEEELTEEEASDEDEEETPHRESTADSESENKDDGLTKPEPEEESVNETDTTEDSREEDDGQTHDAEPINEHFTPVQKTVNEKFGEGESPTLADKLEQKKVGSIMEAISVNHRYMFTKELFDGDREAFVNAIGKIEQSESFDDAVELLVQQYASKRGWDMNSDEVKELLKVIFRKYR